MNSGAAAYNNDEGIVAVCNLADGADVYRITTGALVATLRRIPKINFPFQIRFIHGGLHLLTGNSSGSVEIWDYQNDRTIQVLSHDG